MRRGLLVVATAVLVLAGTPVAVAYAAGPPGAAGPVRQEAEDARISKGTVAADHPGFSGRGFVDYAPSAGGFVEFTFDAPTAGWALLTVRFANGSRDERPVSISVNGETHPTDLVFGPTGSWSTWQDLTVTPLLAAGVNRIRFTATSGRGGPNVDWLESQLTTETTDFQAEDAVISQGTVESAHAGFTGHGYVNTANAAGGYVEWTVNSPRQAFVGIFWRFANGTAQDRTTRLTINGQTVVEDWLFRGSGGGWTRWDVGGLTVLLDEGVNTVRLTATTPDGGPNYDKLIVEVPR